MIRSLKILCSAFLGSIVVLASTPHLANAAIQTINLSGEILNGISPVNSFNGGSFIVAETGIQPTGTGVFNSFLRIQQTGSESGYNTSVDFSQLLDDKKGIFTHALELKDVPVVSIGNVNYREFVLDANQKDNKPYLSLNQIQLFQSNADVGLVHTVLSADNTHEAVISFPSATNIFSLNSRNVLQYEIQINYGHGSGSGDMFFYVEDSLFDPNQKYVTLFSQFGNPSGYYASNAGFEEWGVKQADCVTTPEPAAVIIWTLLGVCFVGLAVVRRHWNAKS